jgi:hypothetical protein
MSVNYNNTVKSNRMQTVMDAIMNKTYVVGTGTAAASSLVIGTSALSGATGVLATLALDTTPLTLNAGPPPNLTFNDTPILVNASATGTAAKAEIRNTGGTVVIDSLTVGTSASDIIVNSTSFTSGQQVSITAGTITHS